MEVTSSYGRTKSDEKGFEMTVAEKYQKFREANPISSIPEVKISVHRWDDDGFDNTLYRAPERTPFHMFGGRKGTKVKQ